jgi:hypothetical protein
MSDIVFDETDQVTVLCNNLNVKGHDFVLDSVERRKLGGGPRFRRALVHDQADGLTVNFGNDYPGGVTLHGVRTLEFIISHHDQFLPEGGNPPDETLTLAEVVKALRSEIADLRTKVVALSKQ